MIQVNSTCQTVGGDTAETTLSVYENESRFVQYFERAYSALEFLDAKEAVEYLQRYHPEFQYLLNTDESLIYYTKDGYVCGSYEVVSV